ncbi:uncharacterized protein LOC105931942 [Fundulus heteroclitus]|uniref:uncharacterized protein LOC105931942 n=1 Tax=Fundulus heteroclitus TaxID=8078 RepID=UPI00165B8859|nr:uncharacterized protein LOC105931942 [Fundulus heteroclitus]
MVKWCTATNGSRHLVDEILHSILFLGKITIPSFSPEEIFGDVLDGLKNTYPEPFESCETHLPRRSPFSCVLDMVVLQNQPNNEDAIRSSLKNLVNSLEAKVLTSNSLEAKVLTSTVVCVSHSNTSGKHYGVSMSTTVPFARKIVIAASCLSSYWDEYVAGAVMSYDPDRMTRREYFDGTINFPQEATCKAYLVTDVTEYKPPCKSCQELFGLPDEETEEPRFPYGNCAEAESLSNLFKSDETIKQQCQPISPLHTPENRETARADTQMFLKDVLERARFNTWENHYYPA